MTSTIIIVAIAKNRIKDVLTIAPHKVTHPKGLLWLHQQRVTMDKPGGKAWHIITQTTFKESGNAATV